MVSPDQREGGIDYVGWIEKYPWLIGLVAKAFIVAADLKIMARARGKENLNKAVLHVVRGEGGLVVAPNHLSMFDFGLFLAMRKRIPSHIPFGVPWANKFTGRDEACIRRKMEMREKILYFSGKSGKQPPEGGT
jgi:hypothetical protein